MNRVLLTALTTTSVVGILAIAAGSSTVPTVTPSAQASAALAADAPNTWEYSEETAPMGGSDKIAAVESDEELSLRFPYHGRQHGYLVVRNSARKGVHVFLAVAKGQILCDDYSHQTIDVRFDYGAPMKVECAMPADYRTTAVFLHNERKLVEQMRKSKTMTIGVTFYQQGEQYLTFNVAGIDTTRLGLQQTSKR